MKDDIKNLMALQTIDLEVQKIDDQMIQGVDELEAQKKSILDDSESISAYEEQLELGDKRRRELEAIVEDEVSRIKDRQTKLMNIQTNREYQSILKEIEDTKQANKQREEELVLIMEQTEVVQNKIAEITEKRNLAESKLEAEAKKIKTKTSKLTTSKKKISKTRETQAQKVEKKHLKRYEMLREKRSGLAMAGVTKGVCRGCNMNIPPQMFNELLKEDEILSCPTCNRMMFHQPEEETEE